MASFYQKELWQTQRWELGSTGYNEYYGWLQILGPEGANKKKHLEVIFGQSPYLFSEAFLGLPSRNHYRSFRINDVSFMVQHPSLYLLPRAISVWVIIMIIRLNRRNLTTEHKVRLDSKASNEYAQSHWYTCVDISLPMAYSLCWPSHGTLGGDSQWFKRLVLNSLSLTSNPIALTTMPALTLHTTHFRHHLPGNNVSSKTYTGNSLYSSLRSNLKFLFYFIWIITTPGNIPWYVTFFKKILEPFPTSHCFRWQKIIY